MYVERTAIEKEKALLFAIHSMIVFIDPRDPHSCVLMLLKNLERKKNGEKNPSAND